MARHPQPERHARLQRSGYNTSAVSCRDCVFQNIRAFECGDDGISAHDDCQFKVAGLVSIGNSTGIADTGDSITEYNHVFIKDCLGVDLLFFGTNRHAIHNGVVTLSHAHTVAPPFTGARYRAQRTAPAHCCWTTFSFGAKQSPRKRASAKEASSIYSTSQCWAVTSWRRMAKSLCTTPFSAWLRTKMVSGPPAVARRLPPCSKS